MIEDDLLPRLDARPGPALPIDEGAAERMLNAAMASAPVRRRSRQSTWILAFAAVFVVGSVATAGVIIVRGKRSAPTPSALPAVVPMPSPSLPNPAPIPRTAEVVSTSVPSGSVVAPPPSPRAVEDLLRSANELRMQKKWREAEQAYQRVITTFPGTSAAYAAQVSAGWLRLEHLGDPSGSLKLFRGALASRPRGSLAEEARWGVAEASRRMGDTKSELAGLRAILAAHPESLRVAKATARIAEIEKAHASSPP